MSEPKKKDWADLKAEELLPCDGGWDDNAQCVPHGPEEIHRSGCPAKHKFYVAQALREIRDLWDTEHSARLDCIRIADQQKHKLLAAREGLRYALAYLENLNLGEGSAQSVLRTLLKEQI